MGNSAFQKEGFACIRLLDTNRVTALRKILWWDSKVAQDRAGIERFLSGHFFTSFERLYRKASRMKSNDFGGESSKERYDFVNTS